MVCVIIRKHIVLLYWILAIITFSPVYSRLSKDLLQFRKNVCR